jgi:uncharacterized protein DUF3309
MAFWSVGPTWRRKPMPEMHVPIMSLISYAAIVVAAVAALPVWPWSREWGNGNAGALAYILLVVSINAGISTFLMPH